MLELTAVSMLSPVQPMSLKFAYNMFTCFLLLIQRAKIGPGKNTEGKSANAASRFDSNGNQDRMKLADFNFLMVLGKGSFGKVSIPANVHASLKASTLMPVSPIYAGSEHKLLSFWWMCTCQQKNGGRHVFKTV